MKVLHVNGSLTQKGNTPTAPGGVERHPFEPFLPEGARMLFLGSFPPQPHRWNMPFYYPNWINDFWRIMGLIHYADRNHFCIPAEKRFNVALIRQFCADKGLAFYDTACEVRRLKDNASDAFLEVVTPTDIPALLARIPDCRRIITTGEKATGVVAERFRCPVPAIGECVEIAGLADNDDPGGWPRVPGEQSRMSGEQGRMSGEQGRMPGEPGQAPMEFWRMPSTSRAYPLALEKKAEYYRKLFI